MVLFLLNRLLYLFIYLLIFFFFFFNDTATTEIYTLSLHDALPISNDHRVSPWRMSVTVTGERRGSGESARWRSEEHTSELQSHVNLVCRLLLEKKKKAGDRQGHPQMAGRTQ